MLLSVLGKTGELTLAKFLQFRAEGEILLIELLLLVPGESLPRGGVREGRKAQLLVLKFLRYGKSLSGSENQSVSVAEVNVSKVSNESFPLLP